MPQVTASKSWCSSFCALHSRSFCSVKLGRRERDCCAGSEVSLPMQVVQKILKTKTAHTANGSSCSRRRFEPPS